MELVAFILNSRGPLVKMMLPILWMVYSVGLEVLVPKEVCFHHRHGNASTKVEAETVTWTVFMPLNQPAGEKKMGLIYIS